MNVFEAVKQNVTTRQAAELYGIPVSRNGMAVCPFHNDKNPSMKLDRRFHCFGCQADGDAVDFVSRLFQLPSREAAMKLADDFGIAYDIGQKPTVKPHIGNLPRAEIQAGRNALLQGLMRILPPSPEMGTAVCPASRRMTCIRSLWKPCKKTYRVSADSFLTDRRKNAGSL